MLGVQAGGNLVQDAAGTNLLSQPESCFALSMSEKVLTRTLSVEPLAQSPTAITVLPTAFITVFNPAASFPDSGTIIPHPSLAWAMGSVIAAAVIGLKKQSLYSKAKRRRALTLPQLQVMRC
ncbi:MAG: hypothetical protein M1383_05195 [Patescibacteria group bacterium]|nr:hypothetical protein [Patescibacteria group bacterium]